MSTAQATVSTPERSIIQRREALVIANRVRIRRAAVKREIAAGRTKAADLVGSPPQDFETMRVLDVLLAVPRFGRVKATRLLNAARVAPSKTLGGLTERQRNEIVQLLGAR